MSDNKFTPGPWSQDKWGRVRGTVGQEIVVEGLSLGGRSTEETRANARLIAAAPEMLALLIESQDGIGTSWNKRRDAIVAKALGTGT